MKELIKKLYGSEVIRYIFFGGCTTLVNLIVFYGLRRLGLGLNLANVISVAAAILFAYVVNSLFVFQNRRVGLSGHLQAFGKFIGARLVTMVVEVGGVWLLVEALHLNDMVGKVLVQFLVVALNYLFSKFFIFTGKKKGKGEKE